MENLVLVIAIIMGLSFAVGMSVAFIIKQATAGIVRISLRSEHGEAFLRAKRIRRIAKKMRRKTFEQLEKRLSIEMINHYYGDNALDAKESADEFVEHYYPSKVS